MKYVGTYTHYLSFFNDPSNGKKKAFVAEICNVTGNFIILNYCSTLKQ